jgi:integrase
VTGKRHNLTAVIPPGPNADDEAERRRLDFLAQVDERRNPRTKATIDQLLTRYIDQFDGAPGTKSLYERHLRNHVRPMIGHVKVADLDPDILDSFYAELRRCRKHCTSRRTIDHRVAAEHECDDRCRPHSCKPLSASTIRQVHFLLSGAYRKAVRWRWVGFSPMSQAEPPPAPTPNPQPTTPEQAVRILTEAWKDPEWGAFLWLAMTSGARRGELCAIRWSAISLEAGRETVALRRAISKENGEWVEGGLKTHQQRRIALDDETAAILREHRDRWAERFASIGMEFNEDCFAFSNVADGTEPPSPDGISQRFERLVYRLKIRTTFHKLRHYSATELILAGVDIRTVAGRLGHSGGGTTTLRAYTAWVSEADQRAAGQISSRMPRRPSVSD